MRLALPLLAALLALAAAPALAHETHGGCTTSKTVADGRLVHVDVYRGCTGAIVSFPQVACRGFHGDTYDGTHVLVLYGSGCDTGILLAPPQSTLP